MTPIKITPKKDVFNNINELLMIAGVTYEIRHYILDDLPVVTTEKGLRPMSRSWLVSAGALE